MAQTEYASAAGPYVEAMRTVRGAKNFFFALLLAVILLMITAFCLVRYVGVINEVLTNPSEVPPNEILWQNALTKAFPLLIFVGVVAGCLYVLTLLIGLKISLAGRLEGAAGLTKGFFWALFFLAVALPWQHILVHEVEGQPTRMLGTVPGALFGMEELTSELAPVIQDSQIDPLREVLLAARFLLYPIAALLLLVTAQSKYRPQRVEMPEPVSVSRLTETPPEPKTPSD